MSGDSHHTFSVAGIPILSSMVMRLVMRRGIFLMLALVVAGAAIAPSCAAACCLSQSRAARMMAAMPCCAGGPAMRAQMASNESPQATLITAIGFAPAIVAAPLAAARVEFASRSSARDVEAHATPPLLLRI